jgi:ribA/ribD-fused uncharacterized protein
MENLMPEITQIHQFRGEYAFLSNFYTVKIVHEGITFPSAEHAYQAMKTFDREERIRISNLKTPGMAKRAGRMIKIRPDFEDSKIVIMFRILNVKFSVPELKQKLLATGNAHLKEGNYWHDNFWGSCECVSCQDHGMNHLGKLLETVRAIKQSGTGRMG